MMDVVFGREGALNLNGVSIVLEAKPFSVRSTFVEVAFHVGRTVCES